MSENVTCPSCGADIEITEALSSRLKNEMKQQLETERKRYEKQFSEREALIRDQELALVASRESVDKEVSTRLEQERAKLAEELESKARDQIALELKDQGDELESLKRKLKEAQDAELNLRKQARELQQQKEEMELTVARRIDEERDKVREAARKEVVDERQLKEAEKDKLIGDLKRQIDDLKRKSEQGSQQLQGEVQELSLEELLIRLFPQDNVTAVHKGIHGGDVIHEIRSLSGQLCGTILWESKRTKNWSDGWLPKLRDDQRAAKAQLAVIVSAELPKDLAHFGCVDTVWVTSFACVAGLAHALRGSLLEIARVKAAVDGQNGKMELLYTYLSGSEFRHRVEGIVEAFVTLRNDLEAEKRAMNRIWAKREKQLERAVLQTTGMYGDLSGIIGGALQSIEHLEMAAIEGPRDEEISSE